MANQLKTGGVFNPLVPSLISTNPSRKFLSEQTPGIGFLGMVILALILSFTQIKDLKELTQKTTQYEAHFSGISSSIHNIPFFLDDATKGEFLKLTPSIKQYIEKVQTEWGSKFEFIFKLLKPGEHGYSYIFKNRIEINARDHYPHIIAAHEAGHFDLHRHGYPVIGITYNDLIKKSPKNEAYLKKYFMIWDAIQHNLYYPTQKTLGIEPGLEYKKEVLRAMKYRQLQRESALMLGIYAFKIVAETGDALLKKQFDSYLIQYTVNGKEAVRLSHLFKEAYLEMKAAYKTDSETSNSLLVIRFVKLFNDLHPNAEYKLVFKHWVPMAKTGFNLNVANLTFTKS